MHTNSEQLTWIRLGIGAGLGVSVVYPTLLLASLPLVPTASLAALMGPLLGLGSVGLWAFLRTAGSSATAFLGALSNLLAGALFCAMALVQLAVRYGPEPAAGMVGIWLGLDVAWDVYIGLGTLAFALAMRRHPRLGRPFAWPGLLVGALVLIFNLATFPTPPAEAGLLDVGPLVGLWYLAVTLRLWASLGWVRERLVGGG